jgi:hypothetical protein
MNELIMMMMMMMMMITVSSRKSCLYEIIGKNMVKLDSPQTTT